MRKKILLADDSQATRQLIGLYLKELKEIDIIYAQNGLEAMVTLGKEDIDLLITDVIMPFVDGFKLVSYVRNTPSMKDVPIIIITQKGEEKDCKQGYFVGSNAYLVKPIKKSELITKVTALLSAQ
ncbi:PleD family two-component system response regulator [candidate division CSSED10-310 bacterium]|uniref:PleD family two-component system response regulator n=1 Tax=candidate division CSSED10-310 bacterium TaxID=2855610 RepID=A0ABV6Z4M2_UNCC1